MLQRYLGGYEPGQSEEFRYCDDPLRAHFSQDHVAALADAYGFEIKVATRRVDKAGDDYKNPILWAPLWAFATNPVFLASTDQIRWNYVLASQCQTPPPGATASVPTPELEPEAWYEIYVLAEAAAGTGFKDGRLPGITFRTSRWRDPSEMFAGLGLTTQTHPAAAVVNGDLEISSPATLSPATALDDDQAFQNALSTLGLPGWPTSEHPRLSRLWVPGGPDTWLFAGLLLESPEPIDRPGRLEIESLTLQMGHAGAVNFQLRRRDRARARLLFLAQTPFTVVTRERVGQGIRLLGEPGWIPFGDPEPVEPGGRHGRPLFRSVTPTLTLNATSRLDGATSSLAGSLALPPQPSFAAEPR
jgi:hypothetical protein